jgi:hypothetical protein
MTHTLSLRRVFVGVGRFAEHTAIVVVGLLLMILGLGLGVTMIMLPVGVVIGLVGILMVVGGLFARIDKG